MKKISLGLVVFCLVLFANPMGLHAELSNPIEDLQNAVASFSKGMAESLPFNASLGLNWSDAYIGKVFPSVPPHFGAGGSFGFTTMNVGSMKSLGEVINVNIPLDNLLMPAYAAEARVGGVVFPFDIGIKYGKLPQVSLPTTSIKMEYSMFGLDARYAVMEQGLVKPNVSVGLGYSYLSGGVFAKTGADTVINLDALGGTAGTLTIEAPTLGLVWDTSVLELKAQVSKQLLFLTPYLGLGASYATSKAGYRIDSDITPSNAEFDDALDIIYDYLAEKELKGMNISREGISSMQTVKGMGFRSFLGVSLGLIPFTRIDITYMKNLVDKNWGASLGARFQL